MMTMTSNTNPNHNNLHLVVPCAAYINSYRAAFAEYRKWDVEDFAYPKIKTRRDVAAFLQKADHTRRGIGVRDGLVPSSAFWLVDGQHYIGSGDVRHFLTERLKVYGGNIGYSIRPNYWQQGLGTLMLSLLLHEAKKIGVAKPIITCFDTNIASAKVIEKNGGVLLRKVTNSIRGIQRLTRIYQIDL